MPRVALTLLVCAVVALACYAAAPPVRRPASDLSFKDIRYLTRTLDELPRSKAYVLFFTTSTCPLAQRYLPALSRLEKAYRGKSVQFVAVNVGAEDSIAATAAQAVEFDCAFPFVKDYDLACATKLGVTHTPCAVVLDAAFTRRYRGRIDDQFRLGGGLPRPTRHDLKEALDAVLAGQDVAVPTTPVDGCAITRLELSKPTTEITFAEHVAPILRKHCVECHRPDTSAPFSLMSYEQVAGKANTIAQVVREERMPPWYADPRHTEFVNRRGLSARERETIQQWAKHGKARGDESKLPKLPAVKKDAWLIGKPDMVVRAPEHELPADGIIDYKYVVLPTVFVNDTWVQGVQIRADNPRVLHHANMAFIQVGGKFSIQNFITGTVPGGDAMTLPEGVGYKIPAGSMLILQVHYITTGKPEKCRLAVGLKYASGTIDKHLRLSYIVDNKFSIPPGAPAHRVSASRTLPCDAIGVGLFSHMHVRGRDMTFKAHYPDGKSETLLTIPHYNFDWQLAYRWEVGKKRFAKGTRLEAVAHYDNSPFNPFNPDPKATVRDGQQTHQEMMNGFVFYLDANEKLGLAIDGKTGRVKK